jgi:hypothetical protein
MMTGIQARSLGWIAVLAMCITLVAILGFKVHAVKSEVLLAERQILALEREALLLETESRRAPASASSPRGTRSNSVIRPRAPISSSMASASLQASASVAAPMPPRRSALPAPIRAGMMPPMPIPAPCARRCRAQPSRSPRLPAKRTPDRSSPKPSAIS